MKSDIERLFYELVKIKSDTGTKLERDVESYIYNYLEELPYFSINKNNFGKYELTNDPLKRAIVWGLIKGEGKETVILLHHHDVVDSFDYGILSEYAYEPEKLIKKISQAHINEDVKIDIESGKWIFGRGTADMKAAAAIHMSLIKYYSNKENLKGNILFLSVPDEESLSQGGREGASLLKKLKNDFELDYSLCIDGEPHERDEKGRAILYEGSVGKTMVVVYVRGKKTHIGHIFQGINPSHILSQIVSNIDMNPVFSDRVEKEVSPPPSWSYCRDTKEQYDASIPESAGGYFSVLTLSQTPKDILENVRILAKQSFDEVIKRINTHYNKYRIMGHMPIQTLPWESKVLLFSECYQQAIEDSGDEFIKAYENAKLRIKKEIEEEKTNIPNSTLDLISVTVDYIKDKSPKAVIAFSPPYYPHISNLDFENLPIAIKELGENIIQFAKNDLNQDYAIKCYFMGISDLSYLALNKSESVIPYISPNMPHWGESYSIPFEDLKEISVPIMNIGPWGKDYHKFTERVFKDDLYIYTPELTKFTIDILLGNEYK